MASRSDAVADEALAERLHGLAARCRELAEMTAVPEITYELMNLARALDDEAKRAERG